MNKQYIETRAGSNRWRLAPRLAGIASILAVTFLLLPLWPVLSITDGSKTLMLPMRQNERFAIQYTHSANLSPVIDTLEWGGVGLLIVRSSLFQTYGAGIPDDGDIPGARTVITQEGILYTNIDTAHDTIALITGTIADHHILSRDTRIQLKSVFGEARRIRLSAVNASIIQLFGLELDNKP